MERMRELESALIKADAAGNVDDARILANEIRRMRAEQAQMPSMDSTQTMPASQQDGPSASRLGFQPRPQVPKEPGFFEKGGAVNRFAEGVMSGDVQRGFRQGAGQALLGAAQLGAEGTLPIALLRQAIGAGQNPVGQQIGRYAGERQQAFDATKAGQGSAGQFGQMAGESAPAFLVPGGAATLPGRLGMAAAGGAAMGATAPVTSGDFATEKAKQVVGTAGAAMLGQGVIGEPLTALARGGSGAIDDATKTLYEKAKALGIPVGIPQITKNPMLRTIADQGARLPLSGGSKRAKFRQESFNAQVANTIGEKAKAITSDVFDAARTRIGKVFDTLSEKNSLPVTPGLLSRLGSVREEVKQSQGPEMEKAVEYWLGRITSKVNEKGVIPGRAYKTIDSEIGKMAAAAGGEKAHFLGKIRDIVRTAMDAAISPADQAAWQQARKQWAALKTIEPLVAKSPDGNLSASELMSAVTNNKAAKSRMARGVNGALGDLAKVGKRFMKSAPDSGTADRAVWNTLVLGGGVGWLKFQPEAAALGLTALGLNRGMQSGLNSKLATEYYVKGAPKLLRKPLEAGARAAGPASGASYMELLRQKNEK